MSKMKGTTVYGRRAMLAIENPSTAVEGKMSGTPNKRGEVAYRFANNSVTGDR